MGRRGGGAITGRFWTLGMLVSLIALPGADAVAQARPPVSTACKPEVFATGRVASVIDGRNFTLDDGREVRLAGIEVPLPPPPGDAGQQGDIGDAGLAAGRASLDALAAIIGGQAVELRQLRGAVPDRYGRDLAFAYVTRDGVPVSAAQSAAHELLGRGFARVSAQVGDKACAVELLGKERAARERKLGLWGTAYYAVTGAESFDELVAERGRFAVVEGKVLSVRESGGTIYMNFGRRWSQALTVTILKRNERTFAAAGLDLKRLENRRLRVRGWMEERSGPRIEATRPEQIEIAERN
jgi:endonuclease YncB( thermonuclease family)